MQLSIITITYNAGLYLERTLKSIKSQSNQNFEHWIIDGGSKDNTLDIARKFNINNIVTESDSGIYDAMNKGLARASGKYIWFVNAGDEIADKDTVQNLLEALETKADVYYSDTIMVNEQGANLGLRSAITPHCLPENLTWQHFKYGMLVCHQSFIVSKLIAPNFDLNHKYSADINWEIHCLKLAKKIEYLPFNLSRYLTGGFSVKNLNASLYDRYLILKNHFGFLPNLFNHCIIIWRGARFAFRKKGKYW